MKAKDQAALRSIRAIKAALLLVKTDGSGKVLNQEGEIKLLQKLVKQRKDSLSIYEKQGRTDLAKIESEEIDIISKFLPAQMSEEELFQQVQTIISDHNASSIKDMGRIMGIASKSFAGRADGSQIAAAVKKILTS